MRTIVTGSKLWPDGLGVWNALDEVYEEGLATNDKNFYLVVVHGKAQKGGDFFAQEWCARNKDNPRIQEHACPAKWAECTFGFCPSRPHRKFNERGKGRFDYCPLAGFAQNEYMVSLGADLCLSFNYKNSPGTRDCTARARKAGIEVRPFVLC